MLNKLNVVGLLCRIIVKESNRAILEESLLVAIAVLLGGNNVSQMNFHAYITRDVENKFIHKLKEMLVECFDVIKRSQFKRNTKMQKISEIDQKIADMVEFEEIDEDQQKKFDAQKKVLEDDIVETTYIADEDRVGETLSVSRAIDTFNILLRFIQLLCENHNLDLQQILNTQINEEGKNKREFLQENIIYLLARNFDTFQKVANAQTIQIGIGLVDVLTESIQGPCKKNQESLVLAKILDSSREFISNFDKPGLEYLGFIPSEGEGDEEEEEEDDPLSTLDEFIAKIAGMLTSLLEGEEDLMLLDRMNVSLQIPDLKNRMVNVFGNYLKEIDLYPKCSEEEEGLQTTKLSELYNYNFFQSVSMNKIEAKLEAASFESCIEEAFELYFLIEKMAVLEGFSEKHLTKASSTPDQNRVIDFLKSHTGTIEIARDGNLQKVFFAIRPTCGYLAPASRDIVMMKVERQSQQLKVESLMEWVPRLKDEMV